VGIHPPAQTTEAERIALQAAHQHSDGDDQQQAIDALRIAQAAAL
jgi:hypothetical protein